MEVVDGIEEAIGPHRASVKLSPYNGAGGISDYHDTDNLMSYIISQLSERNLAYIHVADYLLDGVSKVISDILPPSIGNRKICIMMSGGMDTKRAIELISNGTIDLVAFGKPFISNPDLIARLQNDWPLASADPSTFYGGGLLGYTDYPPFL